MPRGTALLRTHHGARWGRVISAVLQPPYPWHPLLLRVGGAIDRSGQIWRRQNLLPPPGFKPWTVQHTASHNIKGTTAASILTIS